MQSHATLCAQKVFLPSGVQLAILPGIT
jgi:hypothetical protein